MGWDRVVENIVERLLTVVQFYLVNMSRFFSSVFMKSLSKKARIPSVASQPVPSRIIVVKNHSQSTIEIDHLFLRPFGLGCLGLSWVLTFLYPWASTTIKIMVDPIWMIKTLRPLGKQWRLY